MAKVLFALLNTVYRLAPVTAIRMAEWLYQKMPSWSESSEMLFAWLCYNASCNRCGWFVTHSVTEKTCLQCQELESWTREDRINRATWRIEDADNQIEYLLDPDTEMIAVKAEIIAMADASFQAWLDETMPDLDALQRAYLLERHRTGTLR